MSVLAVAAVLGLCAVPVAGAKLGLSLALSTTAPKAHEPVVVTLRSDFDPGSDCRMRLLAVAPGVSRFRALDAFISGGVSIQGPNGYYVRKMKPTPKMGFIVTMTRRGPRTWRVTIHLPWPGQWRLIVPNECAPGYMYPTPVDRLVTVR